MVAVDNQKAHQAPICASEVVDQGGTPRAPEGP